MAKTKAIKTHKCIACSTAGHPVYVKPMNVGGGWLGCPLCGSSELVKKVR